MTGGELMKRKEIEQAVTDLTQQLLEENVELIDVEFVKEGPDYFLRVYIDKTDGVTINDCETLSRRLDAKLDEYDWIQEQYFLEVSSPGLDRPLKKETDFLRNLGKRVEVKLYQPFNGEKQYEGVLIDKQGVSLIIETNDGQQLTFNESQVALVKLAIIF
ncbi:ribosome maturation factor RimP [Anoxynatronum buryatiense]|uniref:Ribosome maturation factor RimP n=2 Tax=Anoxynatronum buryatiense TaxID=489973 RepID=A0AA46AIC9_9CLOT|nr:ribosome maturation factor RimP [Anoxynatronum buryatiense]